MKDIALKNESSIMNNVPIMSQMLVLLDRKDIISDEDSKFLQEHKESIQNALVKTWMWRTKGQHASIISNSFFPTLHGKFHQAILEQRVQFTESVRLAKDYAIKMLEKEEKLLDIEEIDEELNQIVDKNSRIFRKLELKKNKIQVELQEMEFNISEMKVAMDYRMKEVKSWEDLKTELKSKMLEQGLTENEVYDKEYGEFENYFYTFLNNLKGVHKSSDGGEVNNLVGLAKWAVDTAKQVGVFDRLVARCTKEQLDSLQLLTQIG